MTSIPIVKRSLSKNFPLKNHHRASATTFVDESLSFRRSRHDYTINSAEHTPNSRLHSLKGVLGRRWQSNNSSKSHFPPQKIHKENPFEILGISKTSTYEAVKRRFLELALETHPDVVHKQQPADDGKKDTSKDSPKRLVEDFVKLRQAFEAIRENSDGTSRLAGDSEASSWSDESFQAWFHNETGHSDVMFTMDLQTRKEVAEVASTQAQGGLDKGGMWEMARAMAEQQKNIGNLKKKHAGNQTQRVEAGSSSDGGNNRRRRRRK